MIDPSSGEAVYRQVARLLEARLDAEADPGYVLPPAEVLAREYRLGTETVREAIGLLVHMGRLNQRRGYGAVVRRPRSRETVTVPPGTPIGARMPTFAELDQWGLEPGVPMLVAGEQAWPADRYELVVGADDEPPPAQSEG